MWTRKGERECELLPFFHQSLSLAWKIDEYGLLVENVFQICPINLFNWIHTVVQSIWLIGNKIWKIKGDFHLFNNNNKNVYMKRIDKRERGKKEAFSIGASFKFNQFVYILIKKHRSAACMKLCTFNYVYAKHH